MALAGSCQLVTTAPFSTGFVICALRRCSARCDAGRRSTHITHQRPFTLLQGQADRVNYLMTKQAKVVAMTCTHAALKRREFLQLAFQYDSLVMEESAQILEIETFIPMLLQARDCPPADPAADMRTHQASAAAVACCREICCCCSRTAGPAVLPAAMYTPDLQPTCA
jgi:AAA domain